MSRTSPLVVTAAALASLVAFLPGPARATAGLSCEAADDQAELVLSAGLARGMGDPFFKLDGEFRILKGAPPTRSREFTFTLDHLPHRWVDEKVLLLRLYRERKGNGPFASVEITIRATTEGDDDMSFQGEYRAAVFDAAAKPEERTISGRVSCSAG